VTALGVAAALSLAVAPAITAKPVTHQCGNDGVYDHLTATGLSCGQARTVLKNPSWTFHWSCTFAKPGQPEVCHHGAETITWLVGVRRG
jgi:hypothetical protein